MAFLSRSHAVVCVAVLVFACETPAPSGEDGGVRSDTGPLHCVLDRECQDGVFCNGEERCMPGATDADSRGCVAPRAGSCGEGYVCEEEDRFCRTECGVEPDADGDGRVAVECGGDDCDDADSNRYPGNVEVCDAAHHDEDCNPATFGFIDADGDGSGVATCCNGEGAERVCGDDCNDGDSLINPRAGESCDRVDNNCDGLVDESCPCMPGEAEVCGMSMGACQAGRRICVEGLFGECIGAIGPAEELCDGVDNDCDGMTDEHVLRTYYADTDGDGYGVAATTVEACSVPDGWASNTFDCDDARASVNPGSAEACNGMDDDCDTRTDEGLLRPFYTDADGDGFGLESSRTMACAPMGRVERGGDCDDTQRSRSPVGLEVCNGADDDCDSSVDETVLRTFYRDADGDGFGGTTTVMGCTPPAGYVPQGGDCADADAARYPGRFDACNGIDDDCNGSVDPGCTCTDGTRADCGTGPGGGPATEVGACAIGSQLCIGGSLGTCVGAIGPTPESCNGVDDDCDGSTDEGRVVTTCRADADGDGYGAGAAVTQCRDEARASAGFCPSGWTTTLGDCNDANPGVRPGATETCNGIDDNCSGAIDEGATASGCFPDGDGDTYGVGAATTTCRDATRASQGFCAAGYTNRSGDCNDASSAVRPGATEVCNGVDDNCSGTRDDGAAMVCVLGTTRAGTGAFGSCASVAGTYACNAGCATETFTPSPPAESCNGADDDCDGAIDDAFECARLSTGHACVTGCGSVGVRSCSATCGFAGQSCAGTEVCNGCDDDADGVRDEGMGPGGSTICYLGQTRSCSRACGAGSVAGTQRCLADCSGWSACTAPEICNGCDDDGDGSVDNGFFCPRDQLTYCTTGCGTPGQRVCNSTCTAYVSSACFASSETCNFCDDDGDFDEVAAMTTIDPEDEAVSTTVSIASTACSGWTMAGTATCSGSQVTMVNGLNDIAGFWSPTTAYFGWGRVVATVSVALQDISGGTPGSGFSMLVTNTAGALLGSATHMGAPNRPGILVEWRFNGSSSDTIAMGVLGSTGLLSNYGTHTVNASSPIFGLGLDAGSGSSLFSLEMAYEPTPFSSSRGFMEVTVITTTGTRIPLMSASLGVGPDTLSAGDQIYAGFFAATTSTQDAFVYNYLGSVGLFSNPATNVRIESTCQTRAP